MMSQSQQEDPEEIVGEHSVLQTSLGPEVKLQVDSAFIDVGHG